MIHIYTGNSYQIKKHLADKVDSFIKKHGDLSLERIDGDEIDSTQLASSVSSLPLFSSQKLVVVNPATSKELLEVIPELDLVEGVELVVVAPKLDKRASYYKKLSKLPGFNSFEQQKAGDLPTWVAAVVKDRLGQIRPADARYLVDRVGTNQLILEREIDKLVIYDPNVTRASIDMLCEPSPQATIFQLLDAVFASNTERALAIYNEQRAQKVEPQMIMGMIAWQLHILAVVKLAGARSPSAVASQAGISPFVVQKNLAAARSISLVRLKDLIANAKLLDVMLKTKPIDPDNAIKSFLIELAAA